MKISLEKFPKELESLNYICGIDEVGRKRIIENNKSRKGVKNENQRKDVRNLY